VVMVAEVVSLEKREWLLRFGMVGGVGCGRLEGDGGVEVIIFLFERLFLSIP
jgi:hypothetical protein